MKEKIGRNFNAKDGKVQVQRSAPSKGLPGAGALLRIANHLWIQVKRAEDEAWQERWLERARELIAEACQEIDQGNNERDLLLRATQALREAGVIRNPDIALAHIQLAVIHMDDHLRKVIENADPALKKKTAEIDKNIAALMKRHGYSEDGDPWHLDDPQLLEEHRALVKELMRHSTATILRHYGEYDIADLLLSDPATFNLRFKAGLLEITRDDPDITLDDEFFEKVSF